jgi:hypothetical protein
MGIILVMATSDKIYGGFFELLSTGKEGYLTHLVIRLRIKFRKLEW